MKRLEPIEIKTTIFNIENLKRVLGIRNASTAIKVELQIKYSDVVNFDEGVFQTPLVSEKMETFLYALPSAFKNENSVLRQIIDDVCEEKTDCEVEILLTPNTEYKFHNRPREPKTKPKTVHNDTLFNCFNTL